MKIKKKFLMFAFFVLTVTSFLNVPSVASDSALWYDSEYLYRSVYEIDSSLVDEELTDFPVLVYLNSSYINWSRVNDDLSDICFVDSIQTTLSYEIDNYTQNDEAWLWVKLPTISNISDTKFFMYYGDVDAVNSVNPQDVWSNGYVGVWHMSDNSSSTFLDSTVNNNFGDKGAVDEPIEGVVSIGEAQIFDGVNDWANIYRVLGDMSIDGGSLFVSFNLTDTPDNYDRIVTNEGGATIRFYLGFYGGKIWYRLGDLTDTVADSTMSVGVYHLVFTWLNNSGVFEAQVYLDGMVDDSLQSGFSLTGFGNYLRVGAFDATNYNSPISVDELRVLAFGVSSSWVRADYYSQIGELVGLVESEALYDLDFQPAVVTEGFVLAVSLLFGTIVIAFLLLFSRK